MNEIKCPECGSTISIDEDNYSNIIKQVRDKEFDEELSKRRMFNHRKVRKKIQVRFNLLKEELRS